MPDAKSGAKQVIKLNRRGVTPLVNISAALKGLDGFDISELDPGNDVGGGGAAAAQGTGVVDAEASFTVDENEDTVGLFVTGNGKEFDIERARDGESSGNPRLVARAFARVTHTFEERGKRRFSVAWEINEVTRSTY